MNVELEIIASEPVKVFRDPLDEINVWKMYNWFSEKPGAQFKQGGWLKKRLPWVTFVRCPAALGGNYGPSIKDACDNLQKTEEHTVDNAAECGSADGTPGLAARYEIVKGMEAGQPVLDFEYFDACVERLLHSGVLPHLNISSANECFTGGGAYRYYHWNELPVADFDLWQSYIQSVFSHLGEKYDISQWRFSCINEPNCSKRHGKTGEVFKVGYRGDPDTYSRQYCDTLLAAGAVNPDVRFQLGNYVVQPEFTVSEPPDAYLDALYRRMETCGLDASNATFHSISLYEVPYQTIYGSSVTRLPKFRAALDLAGFPGKPFKIDEFEIHPEIKNAYDRAHPDQPLDTTFYAASWMAKAVKAFHDGSVVSAAPWIGRLARWHGGPWMPYPKYYVCAFFALLTGRITLESEGPLGTFSECPIDPESPMSQLAVRGEYIPEYEGEKTQYESLEALATGDPDRGLLRLLVFHHTTQLDADADVVEAPRPMAVSIVIRALTPGRTYRARVWAITPEGEIPAIRWLEGEKRTSDFCSLDLGELTAGADGTLRVTAPSAEQWNVPRNSVFMFELDARATH